MSQPTESPGLLSSRHDQQDVTRSIPSTQESADQGERIVWRRIASVRWKEMITASIIVLDLFLLYASISLIGVFFPTEVSDKCQMQSDRTLVNTDSGSVKHDNFRNLSLLGLLNYTIHITVLIMCL